MIEYPGIRRRVASRGSTDRTLIHVNDLVQMFQALHTPVAPGDCPCAVQFPSEHVVEDVVHEGRLARTTHTGYRHQASQRELHRHISQVVLLRSIDGQHPARGNRTSDLRDFDGAPTCQIRSREGLLGREEVWIRSADDNAATVFTRTGTDVDDPIRRADRVLVMLDDDEGVAQVAQPHQRLDEPVVVPLMQTNAGLIQDIENAHQT